MSQNQLKQIKELINTDMQADDEYDYSIMTSIKGESKLDFMKEKIFCFKCKKEITNENFKNGEWGIQFIGIEFMFKCEKCINKENKKFDNVLRK